MGKRCKDEKSRKQWKAKAIKRGSNNRYLRKENKRFKKERDEQAIRAERAEARAERLEQQSKMPTIQIKVDLVHITLQLFFIARIGYRAVSRVLTVLSAHLGIVRPPCPQTVINMGIKLSISRMQYAFEYAVSSSSRICGNMFSNGFIWMIDTSIALGDGKIFAIIALDASHYGHGLKAPTLQNVHCVAVSVATSWTGESIANFLKKVIEVVGRPLAILKDGGTDLAKAVTLLNENETSCLSIDDISHVIANLFKHEYKDHPLFEVFLSICGSISKALKQSILGCFAPPKISIKARWMNVQRLFNWADQFLKHSPVGAARKGSVLEKLRASLGKLPECKQFISRFVQDVGPLLECQNIFKNKGLSFESIKNCKPLIGKIPTSSIRVGFSNWIEKQMVVAEAINLTTIGMPITSDPLESLFGVAKHHGVGEVKDANRIALRLPALCGTLTREDAVRVVAVTTKKQETIINSLPSITQQRREILPNPGLLELLGCDAVKKNLELIPESKNRPTSEKEVKSLDDYRKKQEVIVNGKDVLFLPSDINMGLC